MHIYGANSIIIFSLDLWEVSQGPSFVNSVLPCLQLLYINSFNVCSRKKNIFLSPTTNISGLTIKIISLNLIIIIIINYTSASTNYNILTVDV